MAIERSVRIKVETGQAKTALDGLEKEFKEVDQAADGAAGATTGYSKAAAGAEAPTNKLRKATSQATGNLASVGRSAGAASIQLQQFAGQIQGGVAPSIALSQQAADLGIVLGFPLLGAVTGITAALAGPFIDSLLGAEEKIDDLDEASQKLSQTFTVTKEGTVLLKDEIANLAKVSEDLAIAKLSVSISDATNVITESAKEVSNLSSQLSDVGRVDITRAASDLQRISDQGLSASSVIDELRGTYGATVKGVTTLIDSVDDLSSSFGLSQSSAINLISALGEVDRSRTPESIQNLSKLVSNLAQEAGFSNTELNEFNSQLGQLSLDAKNAGDAVDLAKKLLSDLPGILDNTKSSSEGAASGIIRTRNAIDSLSNRLQVAELNYQGLSKQAAIVQAIYATGVTGKEAQRVEELVSKIFDLNEASKQRAKAERSANQRRQESIRLSDANLSTLERLQQNVEIATAGTRREQAQLRAELSLNATASDNLKQEVRDLAGEYFDLTNATKSTKKSFDDLRAIYNPTIAIQNRYLSLTKDVIDAELTQAEEAEALTGIYGKMREELDKLASQPAPTEQSFIGALTQGMGDAGITAEESFEKIRQAGKNAVEGLGDEISKFISTGEGDFRSFASSVVAELLKIQTQLLINQALKSSFGGSGFIGGLFGGGSSIGADSAASIGDGFTLLAKGGAFDGNVRAFAKGGVPSLSEFSNSIVSKPTMFAAGGSPNNVMGEKGKEAILPLTRTSSGNLGVEASTAPAAASPEVNVPVQVINVTERPQDYISSSAGTKQILNIMTQNKEILSA